MMRAPLILLLVLVAILAPAADLTTSVLAARDEAERALDGARTRIAQEQSDLIARIQQAVAAGNLLRSRLAITERAAQDATTELARRQKDRDRDQVQIRQLADRTVVAARLGDGEARRLANMPPLERIDAALAGFDRRMAALPMRLALSLKNEPVVGRVGAVTTVPVLRLGEARAVALGADTDHRGLMERAADGRSWLVTGPMIPADMQPTNGSVACIPFDAAGSAAHQLGEVHRTFTQWLTAGRFFIWPIIGVFAIGLLVMLERMVVLAQRRVDPLRLAAVAERMAGADAPGALALVQTGATPLDRVLRAGLTTLGRSREVREASVEQALLTESSQLTRGLPAIAVLAGVAPLLGLLGTVTGMIDMFSVIAAQGSGNAKSLSGGISEALICTQAGMLVAIPLLLAHAWLGRLADRRAQLLEEAACGVLGLAEHGDIDRPDSMARPALEGSS